MKIRNENFSHGNVCFGDGRTYVAFVPDKFAFGLQHPLKNHSRHTLHPEMLQTVNCKVV